MLLAPTSSTTTTAPAPSTGATVGCARGARARRTTPLALVPSAEQVGPWGALLGGGHTARLVVERLGVALDAGFVVAAFRASGAEPADRAAAAQRLAASVREYCEAFRVTALTDPLEDTAYLLLPCATPTQRDRAVRLATEVHARLQGVVPHRAMVSSAFEHLLEAGAVRSGLDDMLALAGRRGWTGLIDADTVDASLRLAQFREVALVHPGLLDGPARRLMDHDRANGGSLLETLRAYFDAVGDINETGRRLELHPNTVRYRLRRVEDVAGLSLSDPDQRLLAELQVRLLIA